MIEHSQTPHKGVALIAHRGFAGVAPKNTLAAVQQAARETNSGHTADAIEIDVLPAANGEPVVFHGLTLGRFTDVPERLQGQSIWETPVGTL